MKNRLVFTSKNNVTHRIVDQNNVVHCCPAPGFQGCVLRWKTKDENKPVDF